MHDIARPGNVSGLSYILVLDPFVPPAPRAHPLAHVGPQTTFYVKNGFRSLDRLRDHESDGRQIVEMQWSFARDGKP